MSILKPKHIWRSLVDTFNTVLGRRDALTPPRPLIDGVGGGDFKAVGDEFFGYLTKLGGLLPTHRVLDVGCGCGRMAVPLLPYLTTGGYWGFDIVPQAIDWCQRKIAKRFDRFHFLLADVYNQSYHPKGRCQAGEYRFPFEDEYFDFVFLTSVFTHMQTAEMEHYLSEIVRVLKPGGRCLITFFVLNPESQRLIAEDVSHFKFEHALTQCWTNNAKLPEAAIAFEEAFVRQTFAGHPLQLEEPVRYGSWCGRSEFLSFQDIIIATKSQ